MLPAVVILVILVDGGASGLRRLEGLVRFLSERVVETAAARLSGREREALGEPMSRSAELSSHQPEFGFGDRKSLTGSVFQALGR